MIQEILDYLLIKSQFILCTEEELLEKVKDEKILEIYCDIICTIIENENFFYTDEKLMKKLDTIVREKRFEGRHKNELIVDFNIIVETINKYKTLSESDKIIITANWIDEEAKARDIPFRKFPGCTVDVIHNYIKYESYYTRLLFTDDIEVEVEYPLYLLGTINLLCNRYPDIIIQNVDAAERCTSILLLMKDVYKKTIIANSMIRKTLKRLEKVSENIPEEDIVKYEKIMKKTKK